MKIIVTVTIPNGNTVKICIQSVSFPKITVNSQSIISKDLDIGKLFPIVQSMLDNNTVLATT